MNPAVPEAQRPTCNSESPKRALGIEISASSSWYLPSARLAVIAPLTKSVIGRSPRPCDDNTGGHRNRSCAALRVYTLSEKCYISIHNSSDEGPSRGVAEWCAWTQIKNYRTVMSIYIAVSGAQGVGKTTFCNDLAAALAASRTPAPSVEVRGDVARSLIAHGVSSDAGTSSEEYPLYFEGHVRNMFEPTSADFVLCERTIVDTIAYAKLNGNLDANWLRFAATLGRLTLSRFSLYCFIPIEFALESDGVRYADSTYQSNLAATINRVLEETVSTYRVVRGSRSERVAYVLAELTAGGY